MAIDTITSETPIARQNIQIFVISILLLKHRCKAAATTLMPHYSLGLGNGPVRVAKTSTGIVCKPPSTAYTRIV